MESNWRWNAWLANAGLGPFRLVARLVTPILGYQAIGVIDLDGVGLLLLVLLDTEGRAINALSLQVISGFGFPYGYDVLPD